MTVHLQRAHLLIQQERHEEAEKELGLALAQEPNSAQVHALLALCLLRREQYQQATECAQRAVALQPDWPFVYYTLAIVWTERNHLDKAEEVLAEAIAMSPEEPDFHSLRGRIRFAQSDWDGALEAVQEALAFDPEHLEALNLRAMALQKLGRAEDAQNELQATLQLAPESAETHAVFGWSYLQKGDRAKATEHFREALRLNPELEWAQAGVVEALRAWNPAYRMLLKYFFWMGSLGRRGQWGVILGAFILYRIVRAIAESSPSLRPWMMPLIAAYLAFVVASWLGKPLMSLALYLHPFGRLALSRDDRLGANCVGACLFVAIVSGLLYLAFPINGLLLLALVSAGMLLPVGATFAAATPWPRKGLAIYTLAVGAAGIVFVLTGFLFADLPAGQKPVGLALVGRALGGLCALAYFVGIVLSLLLGNILNSIRWKR